MSTTTNVTPLKINVLTQEQYDNNVHNAEELYFIPPMEDDYVVEIGTESFWTYRKWNSGLAECWGTVTVTLTHYSTWGSGYGYYTEQNFPTNFFIEPPAISYSARTVNSFAFTALSLGLTAQKANYYTLSSNGGQRTVTFFIIATGKWKQVSEIVSYDITTQIDYSGESDYRATWTEGGVTWTCQTGNGVDISLENNGGLKITSVSHSRYPNANWHASSVAGSYWKADNGSFGYVTGTITYAYEPL